ncbi:DUF6562 domain-containing protein [Phocaeicola sp.]
MKLHRTWLSCLFMLYFFAGLISCDKKSEDMPHSPDGTNQLEVSIQMKDADVPIHDTWLFVFADDMMMQHDYIDNSEDFTSLKTNLPSALYTVIVVMNVGPQFLPSDSFSKSVPDATLSGFMLWLADQGKNYPEILTGMAQIDLKENEPNSLTVTVQKGLEGIPFSNLHLILTLPGESWSDYTPFRAASGYSLRCVTEICAAGTGNSQFRRVMRPFVETSDNDETHYAVDFSLPDGKYDLHLWMDYVPEDSDEDARYITTEGLNAVRTVTTSYEAACGNMSEAFYTGLAGIAMVRQTQEVQTLATSLKSPFAKYRLLSEDVELYNQLVTKGIFPPLEELTVTVVYEGFFPTAFHVSQARPNDAEDGISYVVPYPPVINESGEAQVGGDLIFADDAGSSVMVDIIISDNEGKEVSRVNGVKIEYRQGYITTVRGEFLTAGKSSGGIHIDTEWEEELEVKF